MATLSLGWLLGWVTGPLLIGDDSTLRMDYFKLLPIPARKLARALLGAAFANVSLGGEASTRPLHQFPGSCTL